jgi:serine/threonine-protein kinase
MPELFTGTVVASKYRVVKRLGRGGFGAVYLVEDTHLEGERFALKIPHDHLIDDEMLRRFRSEAQRLNRLSHPHICGFRGFFELPTERLAFFLLEYVEGPTLLKVLYPEGLTDDDGRPRRGVKIGVTRSFRIARQVLHALEHAHGTIDPQRGPTPIVHRDVKPENVLLAWPGTDHESAKVLDFGIARVLGGTRHTRSGAGFVGTGVYAAPEQAKGKSAEIDARSDVFALGSMLYEMLTGRLPFDAENEMGAILQRQEHQSEKGAPVPTFAERAPDRKFPEGVEALVRKAQELDPKRRFQSAREMIEAIDVLAASVGKRRRSSSSGDRAGARGRRRSERTLRRGDRERRRDRRRTSTDHRKRAMRHPCRWPRSARHRRARTWAALESLSVRARREGRRPPAPEGVVVLGRGAGALPLPRSSSRSSWWSWDGVRPRV